SLEYLTSEIGLSISIEEDVQRDTSYAIGVRNIITHNRGRSNERFLRKLEDDTLELDVPIILGREAAGHYVQTILRVAELIDLAFVPKFGINDFANFIPFSTLKEGVEIA